MKLTCTINGPSRRFGVRWLTASGLSGLDRSLSADGYNMGHLRFGVYYSITIIRNPPGPNSVGNLSPYINMHFPEGSRCLELPSSGRQAPSSDSQDHPGAPVLYRAKSCKILKSITKSQF